MIAQLDGKLLEKSPDEVLVDVGGVGYSLRVPLSTYLELPAAGARVRLRVHTYVREDTFQLYGFLTVQERSTFVLLLGVNGIGPKLALAILSGLPVARLVGAVQRNDLVAIRAIPGVGTRTAERILVELREKVARLAPAEPAEDARDEVEEAAVSALVNLGYAPAQAERAVRKAIDAVAEPARLEDLIREALRVAAG